MKTALSKTRIANTATAVISICLHLLFLGLPFQLQPKATPEEKIFHEPIEIVNIPSFQKNEIKKKALINTKNSIVESEDARNNEIDPEARFLSEKNQKVEIESRAKLTDDFRRKSGTGSGTRAEALSQAPTQDMEKSKSKTLSENSDEEFRNLQRENENAGIKRSWKSLSLRDLSVAGDGGDTAASDDYVPGVKVTDRTVLSTREFKFYSYYNRIKELLRQYWKPMIESKVNHMIRRGKSISGNEMLTSLQITLDDDGSITKIAKLNSSGYSELDDAAVEAFYKAGPFPNPPRQIIEQDGFVRIRWDFILTLEAAPIVQFQKPDFQHY